MTLATPLVADLVKNELDVAAWNARHPEHPRSGDGRFSMVASALQRIKDAFGDVVTHEEFGEEDHHFSDHGVLTLHDDGMVSISHVDTGEDDVTDLEPIDRDSGVLAQLSHDQMEQLGDDIEYAIGQAEDIDTPGTHLSVDNDPGDGSYEFPVETTFGMMDDGTRYVAIEGSDSPHSLQMNLEHAQDFLDSIHSMRERQETYNSDKEDPYLVRSLPPDEQLMRRTHVTSDDHADVMLAIVATPDGRRLRLGLGGEDRITERQFTGGQGTMVADLGPEHADEVAQAVDDFLQADKELIARGERGIAFEDEWEAANPRWGELRDQGWGIWQTGDGEIVQRGSSSRGTVENAPPEIAAEMKALRDQAHDYITSKIGDMPEEGEDVDVKEIETPGGTLVFRMIAREWGAESNYYLTVRPHGADPEEWSDREYMEELHAGMTAAHLKQLKKKVVTAFQDADGNPITKSEGAAMNAVYAWAPITKSVKQDDGTLMVYGPVSDASLDRDGQRMNQAWLDKAMPRWKEEGGNIREQHDPKRAVGVAVGLTRADTGAWMLGAHVVDPVAVKKVETGVLKGFSIGIKEPKLQMGKAEAPNGEVVDGYVCETSLVDRPSNPGMLFCIAKADSAETGLQPVENPTVVEAGESEGEPEGWTQADEVTPEAPSAVKVEIVVDGQKVARAIDPAIVKRDFSAAQRRKAAKDGAAMPDGSFPIRNGEDLKNAIHLAGNAKNPEAARRHIVARARALGLVSQLPESWGISKADHVIANLLPVAKLDELNKYDEAADIANADKAMAMIARLIMSEAAELAKGRPEEAEDIRILLDAHRGLCYFKDREQAQATQGNDPEGGTYTPSSDVDMAKDSPAMGYEKTEHPDLVKAVAEATAQKERAEDLSKQVAQLEAKLAAMPAPGGPVLTKTAPAVRNTETTIQRQEAAQLLLAKADRTQDPVLARGYQDRARQLLKADS